jgi:hypothetical protein
MDRKKVRPRAEQDAEAAKADALRRRREILEAILKVLKGA